MNHYRLQVENLSGTCVHGVSLHLSAGKCVCLAGPSGAGKSRLLRAICDLDPSSGTVTLDGVAREAVPAPQWRRQVALLPPESSWWEERVGQHFSSSDAPDVTALGLSPSVMDQAVSRLSSGERQRLALLRVLCLQPKALLVDEPTANLDATNTARVEVLYFFDIALEQANVYGALL